MKAAQNTQARSLAGWTVVVLLLLLLALVLRLLAPNLRAHGVVQAAAMPSIQGETSAVEDCAPPSPGLEWEQGEWEQGEWEQGVWEQGGRFGAVLSTRVSHPARTDLLKGSVPAPARSARGAHDHPLRVLAVDQAGIPCADVDLRLLRAGGRFEQVRTDSAGRAGFPGGPVRLRARVDVLPPFVNLDPRSVIVAGDRPPAMIRVLRGGDLKVQFDPRGVDESIGQDAGGPLRIELQVERDRSVSAAVAHEPPPSNMRGGQIGYMPSGVPSSADEPGQRWQSEVRGFCPGSGSLRFSGLLPGQKRLLITARRGDHVFSLSVPTQVLAGECTTLGLKLPGNGVQAAAVVGVEVGVELAPDDSTDTAIPLRTLSVRTGVVDGQGAPLPHGDLRTPGGGSGIRVELSLRHSTAAEPARHFVDLELGEAFLLSVPRDASLELSARELSPGGLGIGSGRRPAGRGAAESGSGRDEVNRRPPAGLSIAAASGPGGRLIKLLRPRVIRRGPRGIEAIAVNFRMPLQIDGFGPEFDAKPRD